jgi:nucleotide-binding universal stress UspA family protein
MKTILISTDFSSNAAHAAAWGYNLAKQVKANVILANAITIPAELPQPEMIFWQADDGEQAFNNSTDDLQKLKAHLEQNDYSETFRPCVNYVSEWGKVTGVIEHIADKEIGLIIVGNHGSDSLSTFLIGNHCSNLIDTANKPMLIIPPKAPIKQIKKIAFAFDFNHIGKELKSIYEVIAFAKAVGADVLLTHVFEVPQSSSMKLMIDQLLTELSNTANYPHIYYRAITDSNAEKGLNWLCENGHIDILAMNHGAYSFVDDILKLSHTQRMAAHIDIPLLVYQVGS